MGECTKAGIRKRPEVCDGTYVFHENRGPDFIPGAAANGHHRSMSLIHLR